MNWIFPTRRQWKNWSAPSKLTFLGVLIGIISLLTSIVQPLFIRGSFLEIDRSARLYKAQKIRFEEYESDIRSLISSKDLAIRYLNSRIDGKIGFVRHFIDNDPTKSYIEETINDIDLRDYQNAVIAYGFSEKEAPEVLLLLNQYFDRQAEYAEILNSILSSEIDIKAKRALVVEMVYAVGYSRSHGQALVAHIENFNEEDLIDLYSNLLEFILSTKLVEMTVSWEVLRLDIALKRFDNLEDQHNYILDRKKTSSPGTPFDDALSVIANKYDMSEEDFSKGAFICKLPSISPCDTDLLSILKSGSAEDGEKLSAAVCLIIRERTNLIIRAEPEIGEWSCVLDIIRGNFNCGNSYTQRLAQITKPLVFESKLLNEEDKTFFSEKLDNLLFEKEGMTGKEVAKLLNILSNNDILRSIIDIEAQNGRERIQQCENLKNEWVMPS